LLAEEVSENVLSRHAAAKWSSTAKWPPTATATHPVHTGMTVLVIQWALFFVCEHVKRLRNLCELLGRVFVSFVLVRVILHGCNNPCDKDAQSDVGPASISQLRGGDQRRAALPSFLYAFLTSFSSAPRERPSTS
jgi:hypothetical protein